MAEQRTRSWTKRQLFWPEANVVLTMVDQDVTDALADMASFRKRNGLRKRDQLILQVVEITLVTEQKANWKHGHTGQLMEEQIRRTERLVSNETI